MGRKEDLQEIIKNVDPELLKIVNPLIDRVCVLEEKLKELENDKFILKNTKNPLLTKPTPSAKLYKELLQQETNILKFITSLAKGETDDGEDPVEKIFKEKFGNKQ